jgi:hypothetical protein
VATPPPKTKSLTRDQAEQLMKEILTDNSSSSYLLPRRKPLGKLQHGLATNLSSRAYFQKNHHSFLISAAIRRRRDPLSKPISIRMADANRGLLHLLSSGLIPRNADLTDSLVGDRGALRLRPLHLHNSTQRFVHGFVSTCEPVTANLVLDLSTPVSGAVADTLKV